MKPIVVVTGGKGLVGSRFVRDFQERYEFVHLDISDPVSPVDITDLSQVMRALSGKSITAIVHCAAYTDVTGAWKQTDDTTGPAYRVNVVGTETMIQAAHELSAHLIHISTAYVFDGNTDRLYTETDPVSPIEWYGKTKAIAEERVLSTARKASILRIDQPFRPDSFPKADIVHRIFAGLSAKTLYPQFTDHFFGPTYIPDFARIIDWNIRTAQTGIFHATSGEKWSDYQFAQAVAAANGVMDAAIEAGSLQDYLKKTARPYQKNTALSNQKLLEQLDFSLQKIESVLKIEN